MASPPNESELSVPPDADCGSRASAPAVREIVDRQPPLLGRLVEPRRAKAAAVFGTQLVSQLSRLPQFLLLIRHFTPRGILGQRRLDPRVQVAERLDALMA
jgi:hypothetical protein